MGTGMTMPGDGFRFGQVRHWHQAEGSFFMMCFSMSSPVAAKRILDLVVVSGLETSRRMQEYVLFLILHPSFWLGESMCQCHAITQATPIRPVARQSTLHQKWPESREIHRNPELTLSNSNPQHFDFPPKQPDLQIGDFHSVNFQVMHMGHTVAELPSESTPLWNFRMGDVFKRHEWHSFRHSRKL